QTFPQVASRDSDWIEPLNAVQNPLGGLQILPTFEGDLGDGGLQVTALVEIGYDPRCDSFFPWAQRIHANLPEQVRGQRLAGGQICHPINFVGEPAWSAARLPIGRAAIQVSFPMIRDGVAAYLCRRLVVRRGQAVRWVFDLFESRVLFNR